MVGGDEIIRRFYRGATEWPLNHFQQTSLDTLAELIAFDSAMWGRGGEPPDAIVDVHLDRQPRRMIERYLADFQQEDFLADAVRSQPGKTVNLVDLISREDFEKTRIYREFCRRWGVQQVLSTCWVEPMSGLTGFLSLWRKSPRRPFSEQERCELERLIPHLAEALRTCRIIHIRQPERAERLTWQAAALCNSRGALIEAESGFFQLLAGEWPTWRGTTLPKELLPALAQQQDYRGVAVIVTAQPLDDIVWVRIRAVSVLDKLSGRQREIALHYARGESYRDIACTFGLAESTVRNHIASIFKKCRVHNKIELAALIMQPPADQTRKMLTTKEPG
jgi:DNA-binding CsgD family transcriptional regulator